MTAVSRYWRAFRRWRRARPFWGGLLLLLAGGELFLSGNMDLGNIQMHVGPEGFLSYLLPLIEVACGLLVWFTPAQRLFYAIVAAITSVYSLIGLNLGGFLIGMLLGMVGAALAFGWQPRALPAAPATEAPLDGDAEEPPADDESNPVYDAVFGDGNARPRHASDGRYASDGEPAPDQLNYGQVPRRRPSAGPGGAGGAYAILLLALTLAGTVALFNTTAPAAAAPPCSTAPPTVPAPPTGGPPATEPPAPGGEAPEGGGDDDGGIVGDIVDGLGDLLGGDEGDEAGGAEQAEPAPTPTPTPSGIGDPAGQPVPPAPGGTPGPCGGSPTAPGGQPGAPGVTGPNKVIAADAGQPIVQAQPAKLTGSKVVMKNLEYDGLVDLPTAKGTIRTMRFSIDQSVTDDFKLLTIGPGGKITQLTSSQLTVDGDVKFYCTRFAGTLSLGVPVVGVPIVFTVDKPPPAILVPVIDFLPEMTFTKPNIDLVYVTTKKLTADDLNVKPI